MAAKPLSMSERTAQTPAKHTRPELALRQALWSRGLRYRLHYSLPGTPDLVFVGPKLAVFIDGCFWHGCPEHYRPPQANVAYWQLKLTRNQERDRRVDQQLASEGWKVLRVWEHEIRRDLSGVLYRIAAAMASSGDVTSSPTPGAGQG